MKKLIRLSKIISHAGFCSRRQAEILIKNGDVKVNNLIYKEFSIDSKIVKDISVRGQKLSKNKIRVWCFYKPKGYVCSNKEQFGQKSFFNLIPRNLPRTVSVGRLDIPSEGLIILTNSPYLASYLENPENEIVRKYRVNFFGRVSEDFVKKISEDLIIKGIKYQKIKIRMLTQKNNKNSAEISLREGKNREIRNILNFFGHRVDYLCRLEYGPFKLGSLKEGKLIEINKNTLDKYLKSFNFKNENNIW